MKHPFTCLSITDGHCSTESPLRHARPRPRLLIGRRLDEDATRSASSARIRSPSPSPRMAARPALVRSWTCRRGSARLAQTATSAPAFGERPATRRYVDAPGEATFPCSSYSVIAYLCGVGLWSASTRLSSSAIGRTNYRAPLGGTTRVPPRTRGETPKYRGRTAARFGPRFGSGGEAPLHGAPGFNSSSH